MSESASDLQQLPVLPLKETVVFPESMTPLAVGQDRSVTLIDDVVSGERLLALFTVRSREVETPGWDDLYDVGTVAVVHKMIKVPDGTLRILVQGVQRVRLVRPLDDEPYLVGELEDLPEIVPDSPEVEALTRNLGSADAASTKFRIQLGLDPYPSPAYRLIWLGRGGLDAEKIYVDPAGLSLDGLKRLGVEYVILKRYNTLDPELEPFLAELTRNGRLMAAFSPYRAGTSDEERARIAPFLHNTDTRIGEALERPGPPLEIWQLDGPDS